MHSVAGGDNNQNYYNRMYRDRSNEKLSNDYKIEMDRIVAESQQYVEWIRKFDDATIISFQQSAKCGYNDAMKSLQENGYS